MKINWFKIPKQHRTPNSEWSQKIVERDITKIQDDPTFRYVFTTSGDRALLTIQTELGIEIWDMNVRKMALLR